jgi:hypothetical protein
MGVEEVSVRELRQNLSARPSLDGLRVPAPPEGGTSLTDALLAMRDEDAR